MTRGPLRRLLLAAALALGGAACATAWNYVEPAAPRYGAAVRRGAVAPRERLRIVSFNIKFARHPDRAVRLLRADTALRDADILLLQEMDAPAAELIADSLGMAFVYYPATRRPGTRRDFGNAVLSRWPIEDDAKVIMPHLALFNRTQRAGVGATVRIGETRVRVYSVHLAIPFANGPAARRDQLRAVLADADSFPVVVIGGDFNSETVPEVALERGYTWPTRRLPRTALLGTLDHVLIRGLVLADSTAMGVARDTLDVSDHRPVWMDAALPRP